MKKIILLLTAILIALPAFSQTSDKRLKGLEKEMEEVLETFKAAGFGVAIVEKDKVLYAKGFGYRDFENKLPADGNTLFAIGSCTKAFTSSILGMLDSAGDISLDESPSEYIPGFTFINDEMNNTINIYDLMTHRTGLPRHDFSWYFFPGETKDALIERIEFMEPFTGVREQWYYNNFMFLTQGVIAEKVTGKSWEDNVRERIFAPLGMDRSNLSIDELEKSENASFGYGLKDNTEIEKMDYYRIASMGPAGSINSSAREMANWLITWINNGKFQDKEIMPASYQKQAISSHMVVAAGLPAKEAPDMHFANYGFGWFLASYRGHYRVEHGGNIDGFSASTCFFPSDSIGIVVLANQNGSAVPGVVRNIISDRMLGAEKTDWIKLAKEQIDKARESAEEAGESTESIKKEGTNPSHSLNEYAGKYANKGYGELSISVSGDSLYMDFPLMRMYLGHFHYDVFEPYEVDGTDVSEEVGMEIKVKFVTDINGEISGFETKLEPTIDPIFFKKIPMEVLMEREELERLCGEYELAGMISKFYIKNEKLHLFVPGQPEYELLSLGDNKFKLIIVEGFSVEFIEDEDGNVTECKFIQPNGIFTAKRK